MATPVIPARPGFHGLLSYPLNGQRQKVGPYLDMGDPAKAWRKALDVQYQHDNRELTLEVLPVKSSKVKAVQTIVLKDYITGLAGLDASAAPSHPDAMQPSFHPTSEPAAAQMQIMRPQPVAQEPPANMDHMGQYMFRTQEQRVLDARNELWNAQQQLRASESERAALQEKLNKSDLDLKYKEREYKHDLEDKVRAIRAEYEGREPKPSGLAGLSEVLTNPTHPLAGLLGMVATKFLGGMPGAPDAPAAGGPQLTGTYSPVTLEALDAIGALLPSDEVAVKLYTSLAKIMPREDGLLQLQIMAGHSPTVTQ